MTTVLNPKAKGVAKQLPTEGELPTIKVGNAYLHPDMVTKDEKLHWFGTFPLILELRHRITFVKRQEILTHIFKLIVNDYPVNLTAKNLNEAFPWEGTPQGRLYWATINSEYFGDTDD